MKQLPLCLLAAVAFAACNKPEAAEEPPPTPVKRSTPAVAQRAASPTPSAQDWMWKNKKGKPREIDPLKVKDDGLEKPTKK